MTKGDATGRRYDRIDKIELAHANDYKNFSTCLKGYSTIKKNCLIFYFWSLL